MKNNNGAVIRRLTGRSLKSNKKRNFFIITAIALTTLLIGSVFSIGMSLVESVKMNQIRFAGTVAHAAVGHPTASQIEQLNALDYESRKRSSLGKTDADTSRTDIFVRYRRKRCRNCAGFDGFSYVH